MLRYSLILIFLLNSVLLSCSPGTQKRRSSGSFSGTLPTTPEQEFSEDELDILVRVCFAASEATDYFQRLVDRELSYQVQLKRTFCESDDEHNLGNFDMVLRRPSPVSFFWEPTLPTAPVIPTAFSSQIGSLQTLCEQLDNNQAKRSLLRGDVLLTYRTLDKLGLDGIEILTENRSSPLTNTRESFLVYTERSSSDSELSIGQAKEVSLWWPCPTGDRWHGVVQEFIEKL
jgi:hypothetical protein